MTHIIEMFELDVPRCSNTYGVAPCTASGPVGSECYNYPETCQDPENFSPEIQTLKWVTNSEHIPDDLGAIPSITNISTMPQRISPGENLGRRERATITLKNHTHDDAIYDPYVATRGYNPYERGTHWGKFQARIPNVSGYAARIKRDFAYIPGQEPNWETLHYTAVSSKPNGDLSAFEIDVMDVLTFVDGSKVLFPEPSNGIIDSDIAATGLPTFNLLPSGIGAEYPASGEAAIGKELFSYTRSGDAITITARGLRGTDQKTHKEEDTFQVAPFVSGNFSTILTELLQNTDTPAGYIDTATWNAEAAAFAPAILGASIATPTPVKTLINDLMADVGLDIHTDIVNEKIVAKVLLAKIQTFTMDYHLPQKITGDTDYSKRVSAVYMQYGRLNPLEKMDQDSNYVGKLFRVDDDPRAQLRQNSESIRPHRSRWIPQTLRQVADQTSGLLIGRYNRVSKELTQSVPVEYAPTLGEVGLVSTRAFEDESGAYASLQMQVVQIKKQDAMAHLILEEFTANTIEYDDTRLITIPTNLLSVNLWDLYVSVWGDGEIPENTTIIFEGTGTGQFDATLGNTTIDGDWPTLPAGVVIELRDLKILGRGGDGGTSGAPVGKKGGNALYTRTPLTLRGCSVGSGGGGGGAADYTGSGGGWHSGQGGSGYPRGYPSSIPAGSGGGDGGPLGGSGGASGGGPGVFYSGGPPGDWAIDGVSYVTKIGTTVFGNEIN